MNHQEGKRTIKKNQLQSSFIGKTVPGSRHWFCKMAVLGDSGAGKSALLRRFVENQFLRQHDITIGIDILTQFLITPLGRLKLQLHDTAGQEQFRSIIASYYRRITVIFFVLDLSEPHSWDPLERWWTEYQHHEGEPATLKILVGNKKDAVSRLPRPQVEHERPAFATNWPYFEVSAKTGEGVTELFFTAVQLVIEQLPHWTPETRERLGILMGGPSPSSSSFVSLSTASSASSCRASRVCQGT